MLPHFLLSRWGWGQCLLRCSTPLSLSSVVLGWECALLMGISALSLFHLRAGSPVLNWSVLERFSMLLRRTTDSVEPGAVCPAADSPAKEFCSLDEKSTSFELTAIELCSSCWVFASHWTHFLCPKRAIFTQLCCISTTTHCDVGF